MIFTELRFVFFFAVVFGIYWVLLRDNFWRKVWLLLCSYIFYAAWDWRFLSLIFAATGVSYGVGVALASNRFAPWQRKSLLLLGLVVSLGILFFFKYYNFFIFSALEFANKIGLSASFETLRGCLKSPHPV